MYSFSLLEFYLTVTSVPKLLQFPDIITQKRSVKHKSLPNEQTGISEESEFNVTTSNYSVLKDIYQYTAVFPSICIAE